LYPPLQVGQSAFEQCAVTGILAPLELLKNALEGKTEVLFLAEPGRGLPCQTRFFGCCSGGRFVLLRFDGLAFPAPSHEVNYSCP
jgi:hypothetical protein